MKYPALLSFLLIMHLQLYAQEKKDFYSLPYVWISDTLPESDSLKLNLKPTTKVRFDQIKGQRDTDVQYAYGKTTLEGDTLFANTLYSQVALVRPIDTLTMYDYIGFLPSINCHLVGYCDEVCEDFLLDDSTEQIWMLPCMLLSLHLLWNQNR